MNDDWSLVSTQKKQRAFFEDPNNWLQRISMDLYEGVMLEVFDHYGLKIGRLSLACCFPESVLPELRERKFNEIAYIEIIKFDPLTCRGTSSKTQILEQFKQIVKRHKEENSNE